ncbi:HU family DNA-binding protein [uncultured Sphingorhabdus sp.]|uniref:HU family DNA-binding protein n=1 Tax=uncultured Sphingorhabdus sp. TaxID=1686106 RepID=UPI00260AF89F|nr:HU family DNA-binding protein [uncultured Sphingorhabdus sp.]
MADAGTLTRADIAEAINRQVGLSRADASAMIESLLDHVLDALVAGGEGENSRLGTFVLRGKAQRPGRQPKTGGEGARTPRASQGLRHKVK